MPLKTKTSLVIDEFLRLAAMGGLGLTAVVAPNAVQALDRPLRAIAKRIDKSLDERKIAYYARRTDLVEVTERKNGSYDIKLTLKGEQRARKLKFETMAIQRPAKWDQRWRMVAFDIPEEHKTCRLALTEKLKALGFYMQQRSLWLHPFPCLDEISLIKYVYPEVADHIILAEIESTDVHNHLVKHFAKILPL